nr:hypothetical protein [Pantoea sp. 3.5.1]
MKIGITNNHYPEQRNILVNPENEYINLKKYNLFYFINPLRTRLLKKNKSFCFSARAIFTRIAARHPASV